MQYVHHLSGLQAFASLTGFSSGPAHNGAQVRCQQTPSSNVPNTKIVVCHQNVASLDKKTHRLEVLLLDELQCDVLAISEHWLTESNLKCVNIDGYVLVSSFCRKNILHGGSCLFVKDCVKAIEFIEFSEMSKEQYCEVSAIELIEYNFIVICIYRTNLISSVEFLAHLECLLERASAIGKECVIVGDININWLSKCADQKQLSDVLSAHNFTNVVEFPTRVSTVSSTCLDHVYSNRHQGTVVATPIDTNLSDHRAVRAVVSCQPRQPPPRTRVGRDYSEVSRMNFGSAILSVDWNNIFATHSQSVENLAASITNIITSKYLICFPIKRKNIKKNSWVTDEVAQIKSFLFETIQLCYSFPDNEHLLKLTEQLNKLYDHSITNNKAGFYSHLINNSSSTQKALWRVVNIERRGGSRVLTSYTDVVKDANGSKFESRKAAADAMNNRFASAAAACGAPRASVTVASATLAAARPPADRSLRLIRFSAAEVHRIITTRIPRKPTSDIYDISMKLIHCAAAELAPHLALLFNRCIDAGEYPVTLKVSKISPLFKGKGKRAEIDGYRPVSIIPAIAKIFENGISSRLTEFMASTGALSERQYAYRAGRSTTALTREVICRVLQAFERRRQVAVLCCDLSKAFDVADHSVLAAKLRHYGVNGPAHALLTDVLRNRSQIVVSDAGETKSDPLSTIMGVAQGSSVSNILFSLLLNDLPGVVTTGAIYMYADDVAAVISADTVEGLEQDLNQAAKELAQWFRQNGLVLNIKKTHFLHFSITGRTTRNLDVHINGVPVKQVESITFLGFEIDRGMTWASHIDRVCAKLGSACYALSRLSRVVPAHVVRTCYFATVHSLLQYGAELWGRAADRLRVFRMQKRAVRVIAQVSRMTSAKSYFQSLGILTLPSLVIFQVAVYVRQNVDEFEKRGQNHEHNTRGAQKLAAITRRLARSAKLTHVMGPAVYNRLPDQIVSSPSLTSFKRHLKSWLVERTFYSVEDFFIFTKQKQ